jgi:hypothetical protein
MANSEILNKLLLRTVISENGCMEFKGYIQNSGYGRATVQRKTDYVHRHIYRLSKGVIPEKMDVCHSCDNKKCINPDHLFVGSRKENMQDAVKKNRQSQGFMLPQTKLTKQKKEAIVEMAKNNIPYKVIGEKFGICKQHAGNIAIKEGVKRYDISK